MLPEDWGMRNSQEFAKSFGHVKKDALGISIRPDKSRDTV